MTERSLWLAAGFRPGNHSQTSWRSSRVSTDLTAVGVFVLKVGQAAFGTQGGGWNSDRFCTASGTFTGELLAPDGSVARARLEGHFQNWPRPSVWPSCEFVSRGDGIWTGSATSDDIRLRISDILRCPVNVDGGLIGMPMADFERNARG